MEYDLNEITKEFKYKGLFSEYLPSNFTLDSDNIDIFNIEISQSNDFIEPYKYTMSRFTDNDKRRVIYLPEITGYISVVKYMEGNGVIKELIDFSNQGDNSFSKIIQLNGSTLKHEVSYGSFQSIEIDDKFIQSTYIPNVIDKISRAKGATGILYLDISNFYGSIYTHIIPSIILGYEEAINQYKINLRNNKDSAISSIYRKYQGLDKKVRGLNSGRTNGLLTGPLLSYFLAETLLTRIDSEIKDKGLNFVRYIDDYEIFIYDDSEINNITKKISDIIGKYHFMFNHEKTKYVSFPYYAIENLEKIYDQYTKQEIASPDLIQLFNKYFNLEKEGTKGAIRYLIKSIDQRFKVKNYDLYISFLLNVLVNDNRSLIKICELIIREKKSLNINSEHIEIIKRILLQNTAAKKDLEVIWLIYLLKNLGVNELDKEIISEIVKSENELAIVMILEEYESSLTEEHKRQCVKLAKSWILLYQCYLKNLISEEEFQDKTTISKNISFYKKLKYKGFSFYKPIVISQ